MFVHTERLMCVLFKYLSPDLVVQIMTDVASGVSDNSRTEQLVRESVEARAALRATVAHTKMLISHVRPERRH